MSAPPAKRPHGNISNARHPEDLQAVTAGIQALIAKLPEATLQSLLLSAALAHDNIRDSIETLVTKLEAAEHAYIVNFDECVEQANHKINEKYAGLARSKLYEKSCEASQKVKAAGPAASFGTKKNALLALLQIGKEICDALGSVEPRVWKDCRLDNFIIAPMFKILWEMEPEELRRLRSEAGNEILMWLEKVKKNANSFRILGGFGCGRWKKFWLVRMEMRRAMMMMDDDEESDDSYFFG